LLILASERENEGKCAVILDGALFGGEIEVVLDEAEVETGALGGLHVGVVAREGDAGGCGGCCWRVHLVECGVRIIF
jgi:hypothetical protein